MRGHAADGIWILIVIGLFSLVLLGGFTGAVDAAGIATVEQIDTDQHERLAPDSAPHNTRDPNATVTVAGDVQADADLLNGSGEHTVIISFDAAQPLPAQPADGTRTTETLQTHANETQADFLQVAGGSSAIEVNHQFWITSAIVATVDTERVPLETLAEIDHVTAISNSEQFEPHHAQTVAAASGAPTPSSPQVTPDSGPEWGLEAMNVPAVWADFNTKGEGASVAVLDTGVNESHPEITLDGWQKWDQHGNPIDTEPEDINGHGTLSSGLITAGTDDNGNAVGVAPAATFYHGRVSSREDGAASGPQIIAGIEWAVENDIEIVSLSYGSSGTSSYYIETIRNAEQAGTLVVSSAGNSGEGTSGSLGNEYETFAIGASASDGTIPEFSSGDVLTTNETWDDPPADWPETITVPGAAAPGLYTWTTTSDGGYGYYSGTSAAAPHAAGAAALVVATADEPLEPLALRDRIQATATDLGAEPNRQGAGQVDAHEAALAQSRATANPTISPITATAGVDTTLNVSVDHPVESYTWEFPNRTTTTATNTTTHTFETTGTVPVTVTLTDTGGGTITQTFEIEATSDAPTAVLSTIATEPIEVGTETVTLNASGSTDAAGIDTYEWTVGGTTVATTTTPTVDTTFDEIGTQTAAVTVVNVYNTTNTTQIDLKVTDTTPPETAVAIASDSEPLVTESVTFNASETIDNHDIATYQFAFGDGTTTNTSSPVVTHSYTDRGSYTATVTAIDASGNEATATVPVTVSNPRINITAPTPSYLGTEAVTVAYTLADTHLDRVAGAQYRVHETATGTQVTNWTTAAFVASETATLAHTETAALGTGNYTIEIRLVDREGTTIPTSAATASTDIALRTDSPTLDLTANRADPAFSAVSPYNPVTISVETGVDPAIRNETHLAVRNATTTVTTWNLSADATTGAPVERQWTGTTATEALVASGEYELVATTSDTFANTNRTTQSLSVQTTPPAAQLTLHGETNMNGTRRFNTTESVEITLQADNGSEADGQPAAANLTLTRAGTTDTISLPLTAHDTDTGTQWTATVNGTTLEREGTYTVTGTLFDTGKNANTTTTQLEYNSAPRLITFTPRQNATLDAGTTETTIEASYEDAFSIINTSAVTLKINNEVIPSEKLTVTTDSLTLVDYPVGDGDSYTAALYVEDDTQLGATYTQRFAVAVPQRSDEGGSGGGAGAQGGSQPVASETFMLRNLTQSAATVQQGDPVTVGVEAYNTGSHGTQQVQILVNGSQRATTTISLDADEMTAVEFRNVETATLGGETTYTVATEDDTLSGTIMVQTDAETGPVASPSNETIPINTTVPGSNSANETGSAGDSDPTDPDSGLDTDTAAPSKTDDESPGFGVLPMLGAVLIILVWTRRRAI